MSAIKYDTDYTPEPVCPGCGKEPSDAWEWADDDEHECGYGCGCVFTCTRHITITYSTVVKP